METKMENLWKIYDSIQDLIKFSDAKATAIIAIFGVIGGFLFTKVIENRAMIVSNHILLCLLIVNSLVCFLSIFYSIRTLYPNLQSSSSKSIIYFMDISKNYSTPKRYLSDVERIMQNPDDINKQIVEEIWILSKIAEKKYLFVSKSILIFIFSIFLLIATLIVVFFNLY